ncbi:MAG: dNTP triphosphohydrolase [Acidobacteria bacterium]|nr:dNTP triphosphohydrolase [Acidobacteriota bacterium]
MLAHLRFPDNESRGRRYPELAHAYRPAFQRDRDRIIHSRAFRRLEDKTQVFTPALSDHFRNRLTHTLEVAQVARTLAGALGLNQDLTEALALVHDIGHPPFGHAGESALDAEMRGHGDSFDHNLHALRIVESFEQPYPLFPGLNLTFEVREGIVKHSRDYRAGESPVADAYHPEWMLPVEGQLIDVADEIAYNTADLDDGFSAGFVTADDLSEAIPWCAEALEAIAAQFPAASGRVQFLEMIRRLLDALVTGLLEGTAAACTGLAGWREVREHNARVARFTEETGTVNAAVKRFLHDRVYESADLHAEREQSRVAVQELFRHFLARPGDLPESYREQIAAGEAPHRVACDYIAGMTDSYFLRVHEELAAG